MECFVNVGFGNMVNMKKVQSIVSPDAAPVKRMVQAAKDSGSCTDATCGRRCKSVLVMDGQSVVLSALLPETIAVRANQTE
ncbi:MAG: DUF370 domain-containing protein [Lachnospiraceae bacterium]